jgi:hypothetical protein
MIWGTFEDNLGHRHHKWYKDLEALEASGATVVSNFVYEAIDGRWVRLNRDGPNPLADDEAGRRGWDVYESQGQAIERTHGPLGDSSTVADQAFSFGLTNTGSRMVADGVGHLLSAVLRRTSFFTSGSISVASRGGSEAAEMQIFRVISRGEKLRGYHCEGKLLTLRTNNEHALVTLASGERALVSGGPQGIKFGEGQITRLFGHTHGYQFPAAGVSGADRAAIQALGQRSSWVFEHGKEIKFSWR